MEGIMTTKEVYDIVKKIDDKLDAVISGKVDKESCREARGITNKTIWSLFGVNIFSIIILLISIFLK